jgi:2-amino-4-hydroxy-6-hydroxymethyldihydropteridine diphosphokinase
LEALKLLDLILNIEKEMGRHRTSSREAGARYTDRIIDIDILFYGDLCINHPRLILPHPSLSDRRFVLVPLNEIASQFKHPVQGLSVGQMLKACKDTGKVWRLDE